MRINQRDEERRQAEATLEHRGLDQVLNTLRNSNMNLDLEKFKPFREIMFSTKDAKERTLLEERRSWMTKHGRFRRVLNY